MKSKVLNFHIHKIDSLKLIFNKKHLLRTFMLMFLKKKIFF